METMDTTYAFAVIIGAVVMGAVIGLIPFFIGRSRGHMTAGVVCWILCIIGNFFLGLLLSVPICIVSVVVLFCLKKK